jgi:hypothetical protein
MNKRRSADSNKFRRPYEQRLLGSDGFWQQQPNLSSKLGGSPIFSFKRPSPIFAQTLNESNAAIELCTTLTLRKYRLTTKLMRAVAFFEFQAKAFESTGKHENLARDARLLATMRILENVKKENSPEYVALSALFRRSGSWRSILNCRSVGSFDREMASAIKQAEATGMMVDTLYRLEVLKPQSQKANIKLARALATDTGMQGLSDGNLRKRFRQPASAIILQYLFTRQFPSLLPITVDNPNFVSGLLYQTSLTNMRLLFGAYESVRKILGKKFPTAKEFVVSNFDGIKFSPRLQPFSTKELQAIARYVKR